MSDSRPPQPLRLYFDPFKSAMYARHRGLPFRRVRLFQWDTAVVWRDLREDWGDERYVAVGLIESHAHAMRFAVQGDRFVVVSMRRIEGRPHRVKPEPEWLDDRIPVLDRSFYAQARPALEFLGEQLIARAPGRRGPRPRGKSRPLKIEVTMRLEASTWRRIAATGKRWEDRVNGVLAEAFADWDPEVSAARFAAVAADTPKPEGLRVIMGGKAEDVAAPAAPSKMAG